MGQGKFSSSSTGNGSAGHAATAAGPRNAGELLAQFRDTGSQQAFEEVVRRYADMVFGVCLRTTKNAHDAEDATQAVFLTLAVQCKASRDIKYVGPWLQQVAKRVSLDLRRSRKRREQREHRHGEIAQTLARVNDMVQRAVASARRVFEILDAPDELPDDPDATPIDHSVGAMDLRDVTFRYPEIDGRASPAVLKDVSIRIEPGQTVALCGPSGSGKSTVLNLLLRFYDPAAGEVLLDGRPLPSITKASFRRHFALVQQETFLFNDSILDNIRYGHPEATMEQVIAAAKAANAHDFIEKLPAGYLTKVGERGVRLSGGQKQRISIARAFLANPTVLLLDEPTSSVEPDSEAAIIAALDRLMAGRTTVLTSHRPSLINQADVVCVIEDGRVAQQGPPEQLMRQEGWFSRFMRSAEDAMATL